MQSTEQICTVVMHFPLVTASECIVPRDKFEMKGSCNVIYNPYLSKGISSLLNSLSVIFSQHPSKVKALARPQRWGAIDCSVIIDGKWLVIVL